MLTGRDKKKENENPKSIANLLVARIPIVLQLFCRSEFLTMFHILLKEKTLFDKILIRNIYKYIDIFIEDTKGRDSI